MSDVAFLTGGTGFVGANLVRLLLDKGLKVRCLVRKGGNRSNLEGLGVDLVEGDLLDSRALADGCKAAKYVFHVAADYRIWAPDPASMYEANVDGTVNVLEAASKASCQKIVYCSSVAAIRPPDRTNVPADEGSEYSSLDEIVSDYKKSKYLGERAALDLAKKGLPVVVVNPAAPIGPLDVKPTPTGKIVVDFLNGRIPSYIDTGMNIVDVRDVAMGHWLAAEKGRVGERYILGGENMTLKQVLDALADATGLPGPSFKTPYAVAYLFGALDTARARVMGGEPLAPLDAVKMAKHYMWFDSSKAKRELGYTFAPAKRALADAAEWFTAHGYRKNRREAAPVGCH
jgi:dihydroflavonol-4-reductase